VDRLEKADVEAGVMKSSWLPSFNHPGVEEDMKSAVGDESTREAVSTFVATQILLSIARGAWDVSDEWNQLLPGIKLTGIEGFLRNFWEGKA
jgi:hypothetical protein